MERIARCELEDIYPLPPMQSYSIGMLKVDKSNKRGTRRPTISLPFTLVFDVLRRMMVRLLVGILVGRRGEVRISHLSYKDVIIFFFKAHMEELDIINLEKCNIFASNVDIDFTCWHIIQM